MTLPRILAPALITLLSLALPLGCSDDTQDPPVADSGPPADAAEAGVTPDRGPDGPPVSKEIVCGSGTSGTLQAKGSVTVSGAAAKDLAGAGVSAPEGAATLPLTIACGGADLAPTGYTPLGPTVSFSPAGPPAQPKDLRITLPFKPVRLPAGAGVGAPVVFTKGAGGVFPLALVDPVVDLTKGTVTFSLDQLGSFQVAVDKRAGTKVKRRFAYRAIVGFSMGGGASAVLGLRHPEKFDFIGHLGGEPSGSLGYFMNMLRQSFLAGFCTAADETADATKKVGTLCPLPRKPLPGQHEILMSYEKMLYQAGQGVGLTLGRSLYMRGIRDILRAYGNPMYYNPDDPYLPPGVPAAHLADGSSVCGKPYKLSKFYDREYNPEGKHTAITFCDGNDGSLGKGVFDPSVKQTRPTQILLALDLNDNGKRDSGEPVLEHLHEPFSDVGSDGKADAAEAGFDAKTNPDPAGDNYHYLKNPAGTEGNFRHDAGEPYEDVGIDGVKGTCQAKSGTSGCYDHGEGNGAFDWSPGAKRWLDHDPWLLYAKLSAAQRDRLDIWADAGIRDFLNAHVATNGLIGRLAMLGRPVRIYQDFTKLPARSAMQFFDFGKVLWDQTGHDAYVRYGDPTLSEKEVEKSGDGRHVGTALQIVNRTLSFFAMAQKRWPGGDRDLKNIDVSTANFKKNQTFTSPSTGQQRPYAVFLPPGYYHPANANKRYPVVYFLHGYGQTPDDLMALSNIFANYMVGSAVKEDARFQKFLIVYVDGRCRPGGSIPLSPTGDRCERGTFYIDTPVKNSTAKMETLQFELMDHIDKLYRTKKPADVEIPFY